METFFEDYFERMQTLYTDIKTVLEGLPPQALDWSPGPEMNSIAVLVTHLTGAARFWVGDVAAQEPSGRVRAQEFQVHGVQAEEAGCQPGLSAPGSGRDESGRSGFPTPFTAPGAVLQHGLGAASHPGAHRHSPGSSAGDAPVVGVTTGSLAPSGAVSPLRLRAAARIFTSPPQGEPHAKTTFHPILVFPSRRTSSWTPPLVGYGGLAPAGFASRLEHRNGPLPGCSQHHIRGLFPDGHRTLPEKIPRP